MSGNEPRYLDALPVEEFAEIREYLETHNLGVNKFRIKVGTGVSQCLGIVSKRCLPPDLSRQSWQHPRLHKMLMEFAAKHVPIPFTSIQVNCDFPCAPHYDSHNEGLSCIFGFGPWVNGGELCIENKDYYIHQRGLLFDGSKLQHWTKPWFGHRFTLVFHTLKGQERFGGFVPAITDYEVVEHEGRYKIRRVSDGEMFWGKKGLDHPLRGRKKPPTDV